jgi:hypothetical protein
MALTFYDPRTGALQEFRPAAPPRVGIDAKPGSPREKNLAAVLGPALAFFGLEAASGAELRLGGKDPGPGRAWISAAPATGEDFFKPSGALVSRGFSPDDFFFLCLKTHYRKPLSCSWEALAAARSERGDLLASARSLEGVSLEPSPRARAGYLHRFREALSKDLDLPEALVCVWDSLRPGALSPGSKASFLRETLPALGLRF